MKDCDTLFKDYLALVKNDQSTPCEISEAYKSYQTKRRLLNKQLMEKYLVDYKLVLSSQDDKNSGI